MKKILSFVLVAMMAMFSSFAELIAVDNVEIFSNQEVTGSAFVYNETYGDSEYKLNDIFKQLKENEYRPWHHGKDTKSELKYQGFSSQGDFSKTIDEFLRIYSFVMTWSKTDDKTFIIYIFRLKEYLYDQNSIYALIWEQID